MRKVAIIVLSLLLPVLGQAEVFRSTISGPEAKMRFENIQNYLEHESIEQNGRVIRESKNEVCTRTAMKKSATYKCMLTNVLNGKEAEIAYKGMKNFLEMEKIETEGRTTRQNEEMVCIEVLAIGGVDYGCQVL